MDLGLFPMGDWSILTAWSKFSIPSIPPFAPGNCFDRWSSWAADFAKTSLTRELFPEPDTPQTTVNRPTGKEVSIFRRLFARACLTRIQALPGFFAFPFRSIFSSPQRKEPLLLSLDLIQDFKSPSKIKFPPSVPGPGPTSIKWSQALKVSASCSTTITVFPRSLKPSNTLINRSWSAGCRPTLGSSKA